MSLLGRIAAKGVLAKVYRPTTTTAADGTRGKTAWTLLHDRLPMDLEAVGVERAQLVFGQRSFAKEIGRCGFVDILPGDGVLLLGGRRAGERFTVLDLKPNDGRVGRRFLELGLESTNEVFP